MKKINTYIIEKLNLNKVAKQTKQIDDSELKEGDKVFIIYLFEQQSHLRLSFNFRCDKILSVNGNEIKYDLFSAPEKVFLNNNGIYESREEFKNPGYNIFFKDLDRAIEFLTMCRNTPKNKLNSLQLFKYFDKDDTLIEKYKNNIRCYYTVPMFDSCIEMLNREKDG